MNQKLLRRYIKMVLGEAPEMARVPTQLLEPDNKGHKEEEQEQDADEQGVREFSTAGAVAGMQLPLGMSPGNPKRKKPNKK